MSTMAWIGKGVTAVLIGAVRLYQLCWSSMTPPSCRYWPTCSSYAVEALRERGPVVGLWLALRRIARCGPGGGWGYDPVPLDPRRGIGF